MLIFYSSYMSYFWSPFWSSKKLLLVRDSSQTQPFSGPNLIKLR